MKRVRIFFVKAVTVLAVATLFGALHLVETEPVLAVVLSAIGWAWVITFAWANDLLLI